MKISTASQDNEASPVFLAGSAPPVGSASLAGSTPLVGSASPVGNIFVDGLDSDCLRDADHLRPELGRLVNLILTAEGAPERFEVNLLFVDERQMAELNLEHLGKEGPTDVLAFPIDDSWQQDVHSNQTSSNRISPSHAHTTPVLVGDVIICPSVAEAQAQKASRTFSYEILQLVAHGMLHLCGYDHGEPAQAKEMFQLQNHYLVQHSATRNLPHQSPDLPTPPLQTPDIQSQNLLTPPQQSPAPQRLPANES